MVPSCACGAARASPRLAPKPCLPQTVAQAAPHLQHIPQLAAGRQAAAGMRARAASAAAAAAAAAAGSPSICVVGAGVIGMTSALRIKQVRATAALAGVPADRAGNMPGRSPRRFLAPPSAAGAAGRRGDGCGGAAGGHHLALCWRPVEAVHAGGCGRQRGGPCAASAACTQNSHTACCLCCRFRTPRCPPCRCLPAPQGDTPPALVNRWGQDTLEHYLRLYQSPDAPAAGGGGVWGRGGAWGRGSMWKGCCCQVMRCPPAACTGRQTRGSARVLPAAGTAFPGAPSHPTIIALPPQARC